LPNHSIDAPGTSRHRRPIRPLALLRVGIGAVAVVAILSVPQAATPEPVAGASCTGWSSRVNPPETIRVFRVNKRKVQTVNFRRYVAEVMASGEWPTRLRPATLEAGAVATKQYAWYYTLAGNRRPGFTHNGKCYDVKDDVTDQLFRPGRASPTAKQQRSIDRTWGLTLRKRGRFFLTGYRAGSTGKCAADANGWKLYAKSVEACAKKGWSRQRIQNRYYSPNLTYVWSKALGPSMKKPLFKLRTGNTVGGGAARISWQPVRAKADIDKYKLQRKVGKNPWKAVSLSDPLTKRVDAKLVLGITNRFRVRAVDGKGRTGPWAYSPTRKAALRGPVGISLSGASVDPAAGDQNRVQVTFTGRSVAYVAPTGSGMGRAKIIIGGKHVATVDLDQTPARARELVWSRNFDSAKKRSLAVKAIDPDAQVDFEGFFVLR
jgi:hypothetical protein